MKKQICTILFVSVAGLLSMIAHSKEFPSKDLRIIVPFDPGGAVDVTSRIIAEYANQELDNVKIKIENRSGGGGVVGQTMASRAKPDGYTILAMTSSVVTNPKLKKIEYKVSDFTPVGLYTIDPEVIAVANTSPYKTIDELIAATKKNPISLTLAGVGTSHHLGSLALMERAKINFKLVNTKSFGEQLQAVLGGHVDGAMWAFGEAKPHVDAGTIRILAIASKKRMEGFDDVPTWSEAGLNIAEWTTFRGWAVPKGTPDEIVDFLSNLLKKVNNNPEYISKMREQGYPVAYDDAQGYTEIINNYDQLTDVVIEKNDFGEK